MDLYRFYDANDRLLYVGISLDAMRRAKQHRSSKHWWSQVARMEVDHHATITVEELRALENEAIFTLKPEHNGRRGRPPTGTKVMLRIHPDVLTEVDAVAKAGGITRAELVRHILADAMNVPD